jgi:hypothetical protein
MILKIYTRKRLKRPQNHEMTLICPPGDKYTMRSGRWNSLSGDLMKYSTMKWIDGNSQLSKVSERKPPSQCV